MDGENENENILEAVLNQAFSPPPSRRQSLQPGFHTRTDSKSDGGRSKGSMNAEQGRELLNAATPESSESANDSWKAEYEVQVESWRARSSEARQKAEKERQRWEAIRATEEAEARRKSEGINGPAVAREERDADWETISKKNSYTVGDSVVLSESYSPIPDHSRDFISKESRVKSAVPSANTGALTGPPRDTGDDSQKWEDVHSSVTSSFPSMTFPEQVDTPLSQRHPATTPAPLSATLTIFDSTLPTRTRMKVLLSSLAINMLLPFVNGVMLGFGEIFAKNFVMEWLGWTPRSPASVATTTGIGGTSPWGQRQKRKGVQIV